VSNEGPSYPQDRPAQEWPAEQPYGQQQYGQPAYGQQPAYGHPSSPPAYGGGAPDQVRFHTPGPTVEHPQATLAFVLGLLSVLGLTILGPFGSESDARSEWKRVSFENKSTATARFTIVAAAA